MTKTILILSLLLAACGVEAPPEIPVETSLCEMTCLGAVFVKEAGTPVNCATIQYDVNLTVSLYAKYGVASSQAICTVLEKVAFTVYPNRENLAPEAPQAGGMYLPGTKEIWMPLNLIGFAHETLHAWEDATGVFDPANPHLNWNIKPGYTDLMTNYVNQHQDL